MKSGYWNGVMTGFEKWFVTTNMTLVAFYDVGHLKGPVWRAQEENGFLVADNLEMNGENVLYIYPGFQVGLFGHFHYGEMVSARPVGITGFTCEHGMMRPHWNFMSHNSHEYTYDPAADEVLSLDPLLKDPLEEEWVEIQTR